MDEFEKTAQKLGLSNDPSGTSGIVSIKPNPIPIATATTIPTGQNVSLVPNAQAIPTTNNAMFIDVKALAKYLKDNKIALGINWLHVGLALAGGTALGYAISKAVK